jgi:hypothetical protein
MISIWPFSSEFIPSLKRFAQNARSNEFSWLAAQEVIASRKSSISPAGRERQCDSRIGARSTALPE